MSIKFSTHKFILVIYIGSFCSSLSLYFLICLYFSFIHILFFSKKNFDLSQCEQEKVTGRRTCWLQLTFLESLKFSLISKWGYTHFPCDTLTGLKAECIQHSTLIFNYERWNYASAFLMKLRNLFIWEIPSSKLQVTLASLKHHESLVKSYFQCLNLQKAPDHMIILFQFFTLVSVPISLYLPLHCLLAVCGSVHLI